jgi:decaprenyl-phosphate phosphoribosyltransferase
VTDSALTAGTVDLTGAASEPGSLHRAPLRAALATMRPRQWLKNGLVIAAPGAAGALGQDDVPVRVAVACVTFCLLSGGIYALNDVRDRHEDRLHPRKRRRPVAAGEIAPGAATGLGIGLVALGLALAIAVRPLLGLVAVGYVAITVTYTLVWRRIVLLDLGAIAAGFVLRAVGGGVAAPVTLSHWFLLVVSVAAVMVAAGKREAELRRAQVAGAARRRVLNHYTRGRLHFIVAACALVAIIAYAVWAAALPAIDGIPWRPLTAVPFAAGIVRYTMLVRRGAGETPEDLILGDRPLALAGALWLLLFALGVHAWT